jgi:hypothetical protein
MHKHGYCTLPHACEPNTVGGISCGQWSSSLLHMRIHFLLLPEILARARGSVVGWGTMLQAGRLWARVPMRLLDFFNWPNPSSCTMALGSTQPLTEMSTRNLPGGVKGSRHVRLTTSPPSVGRLSRQNVGASTSHNPMGLHGMLQG